MPTSIQSPRISLVLPTYNEAPHFESFLSQLVEAFHREGCESFEIIVVDDNSADGTGALADQFAERYPGAARAVHREQRGGLATAVLEGWNVARAPILAVMDADGQHPVELPLRLLRAIEQGADLAVASRYCPGGETPNWSLVRRLVSRVATGLARLVLPTAVSSIRDPLSGCFAVRRAVVTGKKLRPLGTKILLEVLARCEFKSVEEVPYRFAPRPAGRSKAGVQDFIWYVQHLWRLAAIPREARR